MPMINSEKLRIRIEKNPSGWNYYNGNMKIGCVYKNAISDLWMWESKTSQGCENSSNEAILKLQSRLTASAEYLGINISFYFANLD